MMNQSITLTLKESDALLEILTELPIKYSHIFTRVQVLLFDKFNAAVKQVKPTVDITEFIERELPTECIAREQPTGKLSKAH